ncbi:MAG: hypothetical protein ACRDOL_18090 [Streptosporangiaceae bacterium]
MRSTGAAEPAPTTADPKTLPAARAEPSWGQVVATTVSLWLSRRIPRPRADRRQRNGLRRPSWHLSPRAARGLWLATLVLALAAVAVTVLRFTAASTATARPSSPARVHPARASFDAAVQTKAAAWIAGQVSSEEIIACDPAMCAALQAHGVAAGRLLRVGSTTTGFSGLSGAGVVVASRSIRGQFGPRLSDYAPALLASFGSGASLIDVRAAFPGGVAAYDSAVTADAAARMSAGAQLLRSQRIMVSPQGATQLRAGEVDSRLLVMLAALASLQQLRVVAFGDASPGVQVPPADLPLREVTITSAGGRGGTAGLAPVLAMVRAQRATYQPAFASIVDSAAGQSELLIEFAAPSPLGLLTGGN